MELGPPDKRYRLFAFSIHADQAEARVNGRKTLSTLTGTALIGHKKGRPQSAFHLAIRRLLFFQAVIGLFVRVAFAGGAVVVTHFQEAVANEVDVAVARFVEA